MIRGLGYSVVAKARYSVGVGYPLPILQYAVLSCTCGQVGPLNWKLFAQATPRRGKSGLFGCFSRSWCIAGEIPKRVYDASDNLCKHPRAGSARSLP
jgi:hypothetical protein